MHVCDRCKKTDVKPKQELSEYAVGVLKVTARSGCGWIEVKATQSSPGMMWLCPECIETLDGYAGRLLTADYALPPKPKSRFLPGVYVGTVVAGVLNMTGAYWFVPAKHWLMAWLVK